jgi:hypothetical protein
MATYPLRLKHTSMRIASALCSSRGMGRALRGHRAQVGRGGMLTPTSTGRPEANRKVAQSRLADDALIELTSHPRSAIPASYLHTTAMRELHFLFSQKTPRLICYIGLCLASLYAVARLLLAQCFSLAQQRIGPALQSLYARLLPALHQWVLATIMPPDPALRAQPSASRSSQGKRAVCCMRNSSNPCTRRSVACSPMALHHRQDSSASMASYA